jgi:hypothetical protein|tara:strand:+ start:211 stop:921 length:711 start_codon:yes stop_codon:yes gene_type:complete
MTTSSTATFNLDLTEVVEEAFERAGSELRSGYDLKTARRSLNLLFAEWANRGINLWTVEEGTQALTSGTSTYNLPVDTVDLIEHFIRTGSGTTQSDLVLTRISVSSYAAIPNKNSTGRPTQVYIDRKSGATESSGVQNPTVTFFPVPDSSTTYTLVYYRLRRILDAGEGFNTMDIPFRFLPCMVAGLAYYLSMKIPGSEQRVPVLKQMYDEAWLLASDEDRDKASLLITPQIYYVS